MKTALLLCSVIFSFQSNAMNPLMPGLDQAAFEALNNSHYRQVEERKEETPLDHRQSICSMEVVSSNDKRLVHYNVKKENEVIYFSKNALNAANMLVDMRRGGVCQIKSEACFLVKDENGREAVLMSNSVLIAQDNKDAQELLIQLQQNRVCQRNGVIVGDYNSESRKLENKSIRFTEMESRKFFK